MGSDSGGGSTVGEAVTRERKRSGVPILVVGGRVLLVVAATMVVLARTSRASWQSAPADVAGVPDHWIPQLTLLTAFVLGLFAPALLLPVGSLSAVREHGGIIEVPTVLGWRTVPLEPVAARRVVVPGRGTALDVLMVRSRWRLAFVTSSGSSKPRWESTPRLRRLWRETSRRESRAKPRIMGWVVMVLWSGSALLVMSLFGGLAGVL